jgi:integrase
VIVNGVDDQKLITSSAQLRHTSRVPILESTFVSERLEPPSVVSYQRMVARTGQAAGFPFLVHSHMLRHSTGYKLANDR